MANTEFIAAKDLPITESEEVDVLCVEGGELKRKPGASLGGGGGACMYLYANVYDAESMSINPSSIYDISTDESPTAQQIYDAFVSGGVRIYVQNEGTNPSWCTNLLSVLINSESIKCYVLGRYGKVENFDYDGTVVM